MVKFEIYFELDPTNLVALGNSRLKAKIIRFAYQCDEL